MVVSLKSALESYSDVMTTKMSIIESELDSSKICADNGMLYSPSNSNATFQGCLAIANNPLTGLETVTNDITSGGHYDVTVACPAGKFLIAGGCSQSSPNLNRAIVENYPLSNTEWACRTRDVGTGQVVTTTAYAICIDTP